MKKLMVSVAVISLFSASFVYAAKEASAPSGDAVKKLEASRKAIEEKKLELNGSEWQLDMTSSDSKGKADKEVFTFQNGQVTCKMLTARGFKPTNYTISLPDGSDMAVWETMQTNDKGNVVFIRGEWKADMMRGVISEQLEGGKSRDYNFASAGKVAVEPTTAKAEEPKKAEPKAEAKKEEATEKVAASPAKAEEVKKAAEPVKEKKKKKKLF